MQAVILCGGRGERLMPMTACTPGGLLRITGRPVISYALEQLENADFKKVTLALGYLGEQVREEYENYSGKIEIAFSESCCCGTAPALKKAAQSMDDILVIEANCIFDLDIKGVIAYHRAKKAAATFVTSRQPDNSEYTCFSTDKRNLITSAEKEPGCGNVSAVHAFTGIYILSKQIAESYDLDGFSDIVDQLVPQLLSDGCKLYTYGSRKFWRKIIRPQGFLSCQREMLYGRSGIKVSASSSYDGIFTETEGNFHGVSIVPPVYFGKNVVIKPGAIIEAGSVIDDNAVVESRSRISGSYVGREAAVGERCELSGSVVCTAAQLKSSVFCGEYSVCGERSVLGEGTKLSDGAKLWAGKETAPNTMVSENITTGMGKPARIDDECAYCFGSGADSPVKTMRFGMAVGTALDIGSTAVVGRTATAAGKALCSAFETGLASCGISVLDLGECTQQQVMYAVNRFGANIGCYADSGFSQRIKLMDKGGLPIVRKLERAVEKAFNNNNFRTLAYHEYKEVRSMDGVYVLYEDFLRSMLPDRFTGINVEVRSASSITASVCDRLFRCRNDIDGERIVFHISNDGTACSAYSDKTGYIFHERLVLLAMKAAYQKGIPVSVPFVFPMAADGIAEDENGRLYRYYNDSDGVSDSEARQAAQRPDNFFVRDALALICTIAGYLCEKGSTFSEAVKKVPGFYATQRYISLKGDNADTLRRFTAFKNGSEEGVIFENDSSRAVVRPIKDGSGLMIFAESFKSESAAALCDEIQEKLKSYPQTKPEQSNE